MKFLYARLTGNSITTNVLYLPSAIAALFVLKILYVFQILAFSAVWGPLVVTIFSGASNCAGLSFFPGSGNNKKVSTFFSLSERSWVFECLSKAFRTHPFFVRTCCEQLHSLTSDFLFEHIASFECVGALTVSKRLLDREVYCAFFGSRVRGSIHHTSLLPMTSDMLFCSFWGLMLGNHMNSYGSRTLFFHRDEKVDLPYEFIWFADPIFS